jgi:hypothetical protein
MWLRFIDDDHIGRGQRQFVGAQTPRPQGLNARDLDWVFKVEIQTGLNESVLKRYLERRLLEDFAPVRQHQHTLAGLHHSLDDGGCNHGLAGAGRQHVKHFHGGIECYLNVVDRGVLVVAEVGHGRLAFANAAANVACTMSSPTDWTRPDHSAAS